jgi:hypothetical protein
MSNVLIGIVGVVLFIGLSLAGASFFGPVMTDSMTEARASGVVQIMSTTAKAVSMRNREQETTTPASADSSSLVPDYLVEVPVNPVNGNPVMLVNANGTTAGGMTRLIVTKMTTNDAGMCAYIDRQGGGNGTIQTLGALPSQTIGCARAGYTVGPFVNGDLFAYMTVG